MTLRGWIRNTGRLLFRRPQVEADLDAEVRAYRDLLMDRNVRAGMSEPEARRAAQLEMEGVEQVKEQVREARAGTALDAFLWDMRGAIRSMVRYPASTALVVATLALGIGAGTAIFSVVDAVLVQQLPYPDPDRIVMVFEKRAREGVMTNPVSPADFLDWRRRAEIFQHIAAQTGTSVTITGDGEPEQVSTSAVSWAFSTCSAPGLRKAAHSGLTMKSLVVIAWLFYLMGFGRAVTGASLTWWERASP